MSKFKVKIDGYGRVPSKEHESDAGFDLCVSTDFVVQPGRNMIPTGVFVAIPDGSVGDVRPRSGFSAKGFNNGKGQRLDADVLYGTVDAGYRGEIRVIVRSFEKYPFLVYAGTAIAQLVVLDGVAQKSDLVLVDSLDDDTDRGSKGFGG